MHILNNIIIAYFLITIFDIKIFLIIKLQLKYLNNLVFKLLFISINKIKFK